jgi:hypothetical protein
MKSLVVSTAVLSSLLLAFSSTSLHASWAQNGTPVCNEAYNQFDQQIIADGSGGAIVVWKDMRNSGDFDIYTQRMDMYGDALWTGNGVAICDTVDDQGYPQFDSDGNGGAIITWHDRRSSIYEIYAQRIDASGAIKWTAKGVPICQTAFDAYYPTIVADGNSGAIISWVDLRNGNFDIYTQMVDSTGSVQWTGNGIAICTAANQQYYPEITTDGAGGAIITWYDYRFGNSDVYAQRIDSIGAIKWTADGVVICNAAGADDPDIVSDGVGGAIITWKDVRSGNFNIYAQRVDAIGNIQWAANGRNVCTSIQDQVDPQIVTDGYQGAIITWRDSRGIDYDIYVQRINAIGDAIWQYDGVAICTAVDDQEYPELAYYDTEDGGAVITWSDKRTAVFDVFAQKINVYGILQWAANGIPVSNVSGVQENPKIACDADGNSIITWEDQRNIGIDVYAQRLDPDGYWGHPKPTIAFCADVPGDQGGAVNLAWDASQYDAIGQITLYTIWRAFAEPQAASMFKNGIQLVEPNNHIPLDLSKPVMRRERLSGTTYYWELIGSHDAFYLEHYAKVVPTLFDSTGASSDYHYFQIIAHTDTAMTFWISNVDSGYSIDNLAPAVPEGFKGEQSMVPDGLALIWNSNNEEDLSHYAIYRGLDSGFTPSGANLITSTSDTTLLDGDWTWDSGYYYKVSAIDIHGNESSFALLAPEEVTATGDHPLFATFLLQNFPNPFNPSTVIPFGLAEDSHVSIKIYDVRGHLVRTILDGKKEAGLHKIHWNGKDMNGRAVASGVYFYTLKANDYANTKKLLLLK